MQPPATPLDERIRAVEDRLIARERAIGNSAMALVERVREATRPRRLLAPVVGVGVAAVVLWWLLRGGRSARADARPRAVHKGGGFDLPWVHLLAMAWPLLPTGWRARISPATAATVVSLGMPLAERWMARHHHEPLDTAPLVDMARYAGHWYEIARLPTLFEAACDGQPSAHYTVTDDGLLVVRNSCPSGDGKEHVAQGLAHPVPDSGNAKWKINLLPEWLHWLPFGWSDYWVLHVDPAYRVALVGHPNRRHLWLLSRDERLDRAQFDALVAMAAERGFPVDRLKVVQPA
jgi:apolipoprotein D and lipocalin family protein